MSLEDIKKVIRSLVIPHQNGLSAVALNNEFADIEGRSLPWQEFGADSLNSFLLSLTDTIQLGTNKAGARVFFPRIDQQTEHIAKFVCQQRPQALKRRNDITRSETEKRPCREPSPVGRISPVQNLVAVDSTQRFRNQSPPHEQRNRPFRDVSPERSRNRRPSSPTRSNSPRPSPPKDAYDEILRKARERRGISKRSHRAKRSRSRSPSPRRVRSPSPRHIRSPSPRRIRSPSPRRIRSPSPRRIRSPSPRRIRSPSPRRIRSPSPRRPRSPNNRQLSPRRIRSPSPRRGNSPIPQRRPRSPIRGDTTQYRRQRSPSPRRGGSPIPQRRARSPSPRRGVSPVQRLRARSPVQRKIQTKSISCQTDFDVPKEVEKKTTSCQTDVNNNPCSSCLANSKPQPLVNGNSNQQPHTVNGHPSDISNQRLANHHREDYSYVDQNVDLNQYYYGIDYTAFPQNQYNPHSSFPVLHPSYEVDTAHPKPNHYYDWDAGEHKPIPTIPECHAYWIMAGWTPAGPAPPSVPVAQNNHNQIIQNSHQPPVQVAVDGPSNHRVIPTTPTTGAKVRDPRTAARAVAAAKTPRPAAATAAATAPVAVAPPLASEKVAVKRRSLALNDYQKMRKLGSAEQNDKSAVIVNEETIDTISSESTNESVAKLPRDPRLRRAKC